MKLEIVRRGNVDVSPLETEIVRKRVLQAIDRLGHIVETARVQLSDQNGPKGGQDKHCLISVHLYGGAPLFVSSKQPSILGAVSNAADRLKEVVSQFHRRHLAIARRQGRLAIAEASAY